MVSDRRAVEDGEGSALTPVEFQILLSLAEGPRYGLAISRAVWERSGGGVSLVPGTLYTALKRMAAAGLIEVLAGEEALASEDTRRRHYALTASGGRALAEEVGRMSDLVEQARRRGVEPLAGGGNEGVEDDPILSLADDPFDDEGVPTDASSRLDHYLYG